MAARLVFHPKITFTEKEILLEGHPDGIVFAILPSDSEKGFNTKVLAFLQGILTAHDVEYGKIQTNFKKFLTGEIEK